jgi:hypothetical protein
MTLIYVLKSVLNRIESCYENKVYKICDWTLKIVLFFSVIKGQVVLVDEENKGSQSWLNYHVVIQNIFKQLKSNLRVDEFIEYKKRAGCRCPELKESGEYLFMGQQKDGIQFILDKKTSVVPWEGKTRDERNMIVAFRARMNRGYTCLLK